MSPSPVGLCPPLLDIKTEEKQNSKLLVFDNEAVLELVYVYFRK